MNDAGYPAEQGEQDAQEKAEDAAGHKDCHRRKNDAKEVAKGFQNSSVSEGRRCAQRDRPFPRLIRSPIRLSFATRPGCELFSWFGPSQQSLSSWLPCRLHNPKPRARRGREDTKRNSAFSSLSNTCPRNVSVGFSRSPSEAIRVIRGLDSFFFTADYGEQGQDGGRQARKKHPASRLNPYSMK